MTIRSRSELKFRYTAGALSTVEINLDSTERAGLLPEAIIAPVLARLAAQDPAASATVYSQSVVSVNFGQPCWSLFLAVCGSDVVLRALRAAFRPLPDVECRFSDEVAVQRIQARYHLQDGALWLPADEFSWQRFAQDEPALAAADDGNAVNFASADDSASEDIDEDVESEVEVEVEFEDEVEDEFEDEDEEEEEEEEEDDDKQILTLNDAATSADSARRNGRRVRRQIARADASVGTIRETIEELFGLPAGSVALRGPDGRPLRADASIRTLRNRWWGA